MAQSQRARQASTPRAVGRVAGRVRVGRVVGRVQPLEQAQTNIARFDEPPMPVFADLSGVRRRRLRRISYAIVGLIVVLLLAFWLSQLSGDTPSSMAPARPAAAVTSAAGPWR
jgi:hypothetical protein